MMGGICMHVQCVCRGGDDGGDMHACTVCVGGGMMGGICMHVQCVCIPAPVHVCCWAVQ